MVCLARDYRTFHNTARVSTGNGLTGFGMKGFGAPPDDGYAYDLVMTGDGLPRWIRRLKDQAIVFGRKALPWVKKVGLEVASQSAKELTNMVADEVDRANPDSRLTKIGTDVARRLGSVAQSRAGAASRQQGKLSPTQHIAKDVVNNASKELLSQVLAMKNKRAPASGEGVQGFGARGFGVQGFGVKGFGVESAQNIITK